MFQLFERLILIRAASLLILLTLAGTSCTSPNAVKCKLATSEMLMQNFPDSSLTILQSISPEQLSDKEEKALYSLLYSQALDKNYIDITDDSIINIAVNYYSKRNDDKRRAQSWYYLGRVYYNANDTKAAVESFLKAKAAAEKGDNHLLTGQIYSILGKLYYDQSFFIEAANAYRRAANFFKNADEPGKCANSLSYAAINYHAVGEDSVALDYYGRAIELYEQISNVKAVVDNTYCIAAVLLKLKRADSAINCIQRVKLKYNIREEALEYYPLLCELNFEKGNYDKALFYGKAYLDSEISRSDDKNRCGILWIMKNISLQENNLSDHLKYEEEYLKLNHKILKEKEKRNIKAIEARYSHTNLEESYSLLEKEGRRNMFIYTIALALILTVSVGIYIYSKKEALRAKRKYASDLKILEKVNSSLKQQLDNIKQRSETTVECDDAVIGGLASRINLIKDLLEYSYVTEGHPDKFYNKFQDYIAEHRNGSFDDIIFVANQMYGGVIENLKEQYPALNKKELLYCSMIYLGFSSNAIRAMYMHQNITSIYNTRSKINKKLGIKNIKLDTYLRNFAADLTPKNKIL